MNSATTDSGRDWSDAILAIVGVLGTVVTVAAVVWQEAVIAVGIAAGAGWMLAAALHLRGKTQRARLQALESDVRALKSDLLEARRTASEWSASASNVTAAVSTLVSVLPLAQQNPPPRVPAPVHREPEVEQNENGDRQ